MKSFAVTSWNESCFRHSLTIHSLVPRANVPALYYSLYALVGSERNLNKLGRRV